MYIFDCSCFMFMNTFTDTWNVGSAIKAPSEINNHYYYYYLKQEIPIKSVKC